jgi:23S rRNA (uracil1939-C5)-methyltransferase
MGITTTQLLASLRVKRICYVSCDPATLARDLKLLLETGYNVEEVHMVDLFPQTFHIETVVRLGR